MDPNIEIDLLGVNQIGAEAGNQQNCDGRTIPWLQDTVAVQAWNAWNPTYRDVVILDKDNIPVDVFNLTTYDLSDPTNYAELRTRLLTALAASP